MHILSATSVTRCSHFYFMSDTFPKWKHLTASRKCFWKARLFAIFIKVACNRRVFFPILSFSCPLSNQPTHSIIFPSDLMKIWLVYRSVITFHWSVTVSIRFGLRSGHHIHRAVVPGEGKWWECETRLPVHSGPWRQRTTGHWMDLVGFRQPARGQSGMISTSFRNYVLVFCVHDYILQKKLGLFQIYA